MSSGHLTDFSIIISTSVHQCIDIEVGIVNEHVEISFMNFRINETKQRLRLEQDVEFTHIDLKGKGLSIIDFYIGTGFGGKLSFENYDQIKPDDFLSFRN